MGTAAGRLRLTHEQHDPATVQDGLQDVQVDDVVRFDGERVGRSLTRWTVRAVSSDRRWVICTRQGAKLWYAVCDRVTGRRGPDNYGGLGYETDDQIFAALMSFVSGDAELTVRHDVYLDVHDVTPAA